MKALLSIGVLLSSAPILPEPPPPPPLRSTVDYRGWSVYFPSGSDTIDAAGKLQIEAAATYLRVDGHPVIVAGFTDTAEPIGLARRRAGSVARALVEAGIVSQRISAGPSDHAQVVPTGPNTPEPLNRRVSIDIRY
jgi:outer membrane protein OmpA-like peptidoglycan-associated protein